MKFESIIVFLLLGLLLIAGSISVMGTTINVWIGGQVAALGSTWNSLISQFEQQTGINVNVQLIGFDVYYQKLVTAYQAGEGPDVAFADLGGWAPAFASKGWIIPMNDFLNSWDGTKEIWPELWPAVTYEGKIWGVPWYCDARLLLYNTDMFKAAGLNPDNPPQTWGELAEDALILTNKSKGIYGYGVSGRMDEETTLGYMIFLYGAGGKLLNDDNTKAAFDSPAGLKALQFYTALARNVSPDALTNNEDSYRPMLAQGKVAMAVGGPWSFPLLAQENPAIVGHYAVAIHPYSVKPASVFGGWSLVVSTTSKATSADFEFIKYLDSYDTWMKWTEAENGPLPARKDVAENTPAFKKPPLAPFWSIILKLYEDGDLIARPAIPQWPQVSTEIQKMVESVLLNQMTPQQALDYYSARVDSILAKP